jgi:hypothetical protein
MRTLACREPCALCGALTSYRCRGCERHVCEACDRMVEVDGDSFAHRIEKHEEENDL